MSRFFSEATKNAIPGILWPKMIHPMAAQLYYQLEQFHFTEKLPREALQTFQFQQLYFLFDFARRKIPYYQETLASFANISDWQSLRAAWASLPLLKRKDLQQAGPEIFSLEPLEGHEPEELMSTSGSTGQAVTVKGNMATQFYWNAISLRNHVWHQDEFDKTFASIRYTENKAANPPHGTHYANWSPATYPIIQTGKCYHLTICTPEEQVAWLQEVNPDYLNCNPSTLREIVQYFAKKGTKLPHLKKVHTHSEIVEPQLRQLVREVLGTPLIDNYSAKEVGYIALQCPDQDHYHIQSENVLVEILNENNQPCAVDEPGRVVVTALHNFSSPLIRYEIGDYAIPGEPCVCGRTLPVIKQILGRQRNILQIPGGKRIWPTFTNSGLRLMDLLNGAQFQVIQKLQTLLQIHLAGIGPYSKEEESKLRQKLQVIFDYPFEFEFHYVSHIPRSQGGKYEDFKSEI
jgi:phenylacetate-CoA ligase